VRHHSTRSIQQVERTDEGWRERALKGAYWLREPGRNAEAAIVAMGAVMPEALAAWEELREDALGLGLFAVTSPDLLHRDWTAAQVSRWKCQPRRGIAVEAFAANRPRDHCRRGAGLALVARRSAR
jgi:pyruvate dehydrogenase complex dehydrogenase (E1) component